MAINLHSVTTLLSRSAQFAISQFLRGLVTDIILQSNRNPQSAYLSKVKALNVMYCGREIYLLWYCHLALDLQALAGWLHDGDIIPSKTYCLYV